MNIKTSNLTITTFSLDMAQSVYENSQDDDTRRFVPDEVYDSAEGMTAARISVMFSFANSRMELGKSAISLQNSSQGRAMRRKL